MKFPKFLTLVLFSLSLSQSFAQTQTETPQKRGLFKKLFSKKNKPAQPPSVAPSTPSNPSAPQPPRVREAGLDISPSDPRYFDLKSKELAGVSPGGALDPNGLAALWRNGKQNLSQSVADQITAFSREHLSDAYRDTRTVYYPFGGPDVFYPHAFFPAVENIIPVGLENVGTLAAYKNTAFTRKSVGNLLWNTYYITKAMLAEDDYPENGTLSKVLASLAAQGADIVDVKEARLNSGGSVDATQELQSDSSSFVISYQMNGVQLRRVFYFKLDLSNGSLTNTTQGQNFMSFVRGFEGFTGFYKAASYLSQSSSFDVNSDLILNHASYLVQTDTGIPYARLSARADWAVSLLGKYAAPQSPFSSSNYQADLARAFQESNARGDNPYPGNLPFRYCYGTYNRDQNGNSAPSAHILYGIAN